jgi:fumarylpyruvate hydrolase
MKFAFAPADHVSLPIVDREDRFPVRRIYCVGKNYADHVVEMGGDVQRSEPVSCISFSCRWDMR